jgi:hypothetical protein
MNQLLLNLFTHHRVKIQRYPEAGRSKCITPFYAARSERSASSKHVGTFLQAVPFLAPADMS